MIRLFAKEQISELQSIHQRFFESEFQFPNFTPDHKFIGAYVATDEYGKIIAFCGLQLIPEAVCITDLSRSVEERQEALLKLQKVLVFTAQKFGYNQINCFPQMTKAWERHLKKLGWKDLGKALYLEVGE